MCYVMWHSFIGIDFITHSALIMVCLVCTSVSFFPSLPSGWKGDDLCVKISQLACQVRSTLVSIRSHCDGVAYDWGCARFDRWRCASYNIGGAKGGQSFGSVGLVQVEF